LPAGGCNKAPAKVFAIGIVGFSPFNVETLEGFKTGMTELGYVEGRDIRYVHAWIDENNAQIIDEKIREVFAQDLDLLYTMGINVDLRAKELLKGTDMPVLFSGSSWPVENGLVYSLKHPGGNMTGISIAQGGDSKALEWLAAIVPDLKTIWVPYDPDEENSGKELSKIKETATRLGIGILWQKVKSVEEAVSAIENLPKEVNAIFIMPSPVIDRNCDKLNRAAISRRIPVGASLKVDDSVLISLSSDFFAMGKKTARLAQQIDQGIRPADLPVETSEVALTINLSTAEKIGISIPDDILTQATTIIH